MAQQSVAPKSYSTASQPWHQGYLAGPIMDLARGIGAGQRVLDIGCGNGYITGLFDERGCTVVGIDPSESGVATARQAHPNVRYEVDIATPELRERLGEEPFDLVVSAEVVEHIYDPDQWAQACFNALRPGGTLILTTPYHGYLKNVLIAATNRWDEHHTSLEAGIHIKFFSRRTMTALLERNGFEVMEFRGAGRLPYIWRSMVMSARRKGA